MTGPHVSLLRHYTSDEGTFGRLLLPGLTLFTGELPWRNNAQSASCIPAGEYQCRWTWSPRFRRFVYLVAGVPQRSGIRVHAANFVGDASQGYRSQLNGCIALGEKLGWIEGQKALLISAPAIRRFEKYMGGKPFTMEVIDDA